MYVCIYNTFQIKQEINIWCKVHSVVMKSIPTNLNISTNLNIFVRIFLKMSYFNKYTVL